jgi:hypothetical protein
MHLSCWPYLRQQSHPANPYGDFDMNKKVVIGAMFALLATLSFSAAAQHYVSGYTRANGTYVQPHYQTDPNNTKTDNYSTQGNVNPYTGQQGTRDPYATPRASSYAQPTQRSSQYGQDPYATQPTTSSDDDGY